MDSHVTSMVNEFVDECMEIASTGVDYDLCMSWLYARGSYFRGDSLPLYESSFTIQLSQFLPFLYISLDHARKSFDSVCFFQSMSHRS